MASIQEQDLPLLEEMSGALQEMESCFRSPVG